MIFSRIAYAALVVLVFGCVDTNNKPPAGSDSQATSTFTGSFGDSAKPDTTKPPVGGTNTTGQPSGSGTVGTTDTGAASPSSVGTNDTASAGTGGRRPPGTTDTAAVSAGGRVDPRVFRPTPGVYDTAPAPMMLQKKKHGVAEKAGVHR